MESKNTESRPPKHSRSRARERTKPPSHPTRDKSSKSVAATVLGEGNNVCKSTPTNNNQNGPTRELQGELTLDQLKDELRLNLSSSPLSDRAKTDGDFESPVVHKSTAASNVIKKKRSMVRVKKRRIKVKETIPGESILSPARLKSIRNLPPEIRKLLIQNELKTKMLLEKKTMPELDLKLLIELGKPPRRKRRIYTLRRRYPYRSRSLDSMSSNQRTPRSPKYPDVFKRHRRYPKGNAKQRQLMKPLKRVSSTMKVQYWLEHGHADDMIATMSGFDSHVQAHGKIAPVKPVLPESKIKPIQKVAVTKVAPASKVSWINGSLDSTRSRAAPPRCTKSSITKNVNSRNSAMKSSLRPYNSSQSLIRKYSGKGSQSLVTKSQPYVHTKTNPPLPRASIVRKKAFDEKKHSRINSTTTLLPPYVAHNVVFNYVASDVPGFKKPKSSLTSIRVDNEIIPVESDLDEPINFNFPFAHRYVEKLNELRQRKMAEKAAVRAAQNKLQLSQMNLQASKTKSGIADDHLRTTNTIKSHMKCGELFRTLLQLDDEENRKREFSKELEEEANRLADFEAKLDGQKYVSMAAYLERNDKPKKSSLAIQLRKHRANLLKALLYGGENDSDYCLFKQELLRCSRKITTHKRSLRQSHQLRRSASMIVNYDDQSYMEDLTDDDMEPEQVSQLESKLLSKTAMAQVIDEAKNALLDLKTSQDMKTQVLTSTKDNLASPTARSSPGLRKSEASNSDDDNDEESDSASSQSCHRFWKSSTNLPQISNPERQILKKKLSHTHVEDGRKFRDHWVDNPVVRMNARAEQAFSKHVISIRRAKLPHLIYLSKYSVIQDTFDLIPASLPTPLPFDFGRHSNFALKNSKSTTTSVLEHKAYSSSKQPWNTLRTKHNKKVREETHKEWPEHRRATSVMAISGLTEMHTTPKHSILSASMNPIYSDALRNADTGYAPQSRPKITAGIGKKVRIKNGSGDAIVKAAKNKSQKFGKSTPAVSEALKGRTVNVNNNNTRQVPDMVKCEDKLIELPKVKYATRVRDFDKYKGSDDYEDDFTSSGESDYSSIKNNSKTYESDFSSYGSSDSEHEFHSDDTDDFYINDDPNEYEYLFMGHPKDDDSFNTNKNNNNSSTDDEDHFNTNNNNRSDRFNTNNDTNTDDLNTNNNNNTDDDDDFYDKDFNVNNSSSKVNDVENTCKNNQFINPLTSMTNATNNNGDVFTYAIGHKELVFEKNSHACHKALKVGKEGIGLSKKSDVIISQNTASCQYIESLKRELKQNYSGPYGRPILTRAEHAKEILDNWMNLTRFWPAIKEKPKEEPMKRTKKKSKYGIVPVKYPAERMAELQQSFENPITCVSQYAPFNAIFTNAIDRMIPKQRERQHDTKKASSAILDDVKLVVGHIDKDVMTAKPMIPVSIYEPFTRQERKNDSSTRRHKLALPAFCLGNDQVLNDEPVRANMQSGPPSLTVSETFWSARRPFGPMHGIDMWSRFAKTSKSCKEFINPASANLSGKKFHCATVKLIKHTQHVPESAQPKIAVFPAPYSRRREIANAGVSRIEARDIVTYGYPPRPIPKPVLRRLRKADKKAIDKKVNKKSKVWYKNPHFPKAAIYTVKRGDDFEPVERHCFMCDKVVSSQEDESAKYFHRNTDPRYSQKAVQRYLEDMWNMMNSSTTESNAFVCCECRDNCVLACLAEHENLTSN